MKILICICTKHRIDSLKKTLHDIAQCNIGEHHTELLIVANEEDGATRNALDKFPYPLKIHLVETAGSQANARNATLVHIRKNHTPDTLILNTDDDVSPDKEWLIAMANTAGAFGNKYVYGGRIIPEIPISANRKVFDAFIHTKFAPPLFAAYQPGGETGKTDLIPFGPNFSFFLSSLDDQQYPIDRGLGLEKPCMGEETEFLRAFIHKGCDIIYCHEAVVMHRIRAEQLSEGWIVNRAILWGRSSAQEDIAKRSHKTKKRKTLKLRMWSHKVASWIFYFSETRHLLHKFRTKYYETLQFELNSFDLSSLDSETRACEENIPDH